MATLSRVITDSSGQSVTATATLTIPAPQQALKVIGMSAPASQWANRVSEVGTGGLKARRIFADLANGAQNQSSLINQAIAAGMMPVISYKVGSSPAAAIAGQYDTVAAQAAAYLASFGVPMAVVIWHEPLDNMTGAEFVALQSRLVPKFKGVGHLKVGPILNGFLLTQPSQPAGVNEFTSYTSPALMDLWDWFGIDSYQAGTQTNPGTPPADRVYALLDWLADHGHPDMAVGVGEYNAFTAAAITGMGEALLSTLNTWFGCVWNNAAADAGILTGSRLTAYQATKADPRAQQ